ncbi:hypothetical protein PZH32_11320, partial [Adlercreutzia equolifaciens]|uniref:hypothetical protein n=1 Tax=Adlercreutzia equolifaciens TaxID=446660 RepID=UPI0023AED005
MLLGDKVTLVLSMGPASVEPDEGDNGAEGDNGGNTDGDNGDGNENAGSGTGNGEGSEEGADSTEGGCDESSEAGSDNGENVEGESIEGMALLFGVMRSAAVPLFDGEDIPAVEDEEGTDEGDGKGKAPSIAEHTLYQEQVDGQAQILKTL